jgi:hypothetical protein
MNLKELLLKRFEFFFLQPIAVTISRDNETNLFNCPYCKQFGSTDPKKMRSHILHFFKNQKCAEGMRMSPVISNTVDGSDKLIQNLYNTYVGVAENVNGNSDDQSDECKTHFDLEADFRNDEIYTGAV